MAMPLNLFYSRNPHPGKIIWETFTYIVNSPLSPGSVVFAEKIRNAKISTRENHDNIGQSNTILEKGG